MVQVFAVSVSLTFMVKSNKCFFLLVLLHIEATVANIHVGHHHMTCVQWDTCGRHV